MTSTSGTPSPTPCTPAVEAHGLCRRYGRRWALADVDLRVEPGTVLMITGRNGSGKSTLLRVLSTAIQAHRGTALVHGYDVRTRRDEVRRRIVLLGHDSYLYPALTALENLRVAARFLPGRDTSETALLERLRLVGLAERAEDPVQTFSAGMRKRAALARALLQEEEAAVVLLDEPYGQLDPPGFHLVDRILARLRRQGKTVLMATHLIQRGSRLCDQGVILDRGRLVWAGPAAALPNKDEGRVGLEGVQEER